MPMPPNIQKSISQQAQQLLKSGQRFARFDQIRQRHFWSSYYFAPDANGYIQSGNFPLFVIPSGQNGQGFPSGVTLTERETNWKSSNRVADNQNFEVTEIGVSLGVLPPDVYELPANADSVTNTPFLMNVPPKVQYEFLNNAVVNITYLTNSVPLGLAADFAQASGPAFGSQIFTGSQQVIRTNGFAAPSLRRRFKIPILLQHGETFSFAFNLPRTIFIGKPTFVSDPGPPEVISVTGITPFVARFDFWATESFVEKS